RQRMAVGLQLPLRRVQGVGTRPGRRPRGPRGLLRVPDDQPSSPVGRAFEALIADGRATTPNSGHPPPETRQAPRAANPRPRRPVAARSRRAGVRAARSEAGRFISEAPSRRCRVDTVTALAGRLTNLRRSLTSTENS